MASPSPTFSMMNTAANESQTIPEEEYLEEVKENLQGPHDWRKRLKPVCRQSSQEDPSEIQGESEGSSGTGKSPSDKERNAALVRKLSREDKFEDSKIRERLKAMPAWKKELVTKRSRNVGNVLGASKRRAMHMPTESAFTLQVVNKATSPSIGRRKNNVMSHVTNGQSRMTISAWDKKVGAQAMVASGRKTVTVSHTQDVNGASAKRRVEKVLKARLYLLQQNGPNSFLIGGDSPDHKYRVVIGPQQCSCSRVKHCVHVMFVMLRVFQLSESDPCLWSKTLKNYEVENLFRNYHARRSSLIQNLGRRKKKSKEETEVESKSSEQTTTSTDAEDEVEEHKDEHDEEDTCPICLLEMVEGESLTECVNGCQNKLHHHCIAVWFEECRRQSEPLICPLCRANWRTDVDNPEASACSDLPVPPNTRVSSPSHEPHEPQSEADVMLPHAEPIPPEQKSTADQWIPVLGEELVSCLFSKNWLVREIALKQLGRVAIGSLLLGVGEGRAGVVLSPDRQATTRQMLETCCSILAYICADPVYKVFVATLRTLRTLLAYTPSRDELQQQRLQLLMKPVIDGILLKCADSNKRTSQLSLSAMQELIRGQEGELAVGREIVNPGDLGLGGLPYLLACVAQDYDQQVQFQWLLGRLYVLHKLLDEQASEFLLQAPKQELAEKLLPLEDYENYDRVMRILRFTRGALENPHQKVSKMARHVFYQIARLNSHSPAVLKHVTDLLDTLGLNIQVQLKRKLLARMTSDFHFTQRASKYFEAEMDHPSVVQDLLSHTPLESDPSTPRSISPPAASATPPRLSVTVSNFVSGNLNFVPLAPPNSPERRRGPEGRSKSGTSGTETDSSISGGASVAGVDVTDGIEIPKLHDICHASTPRKQEKSFHEVKPPKVDESVSTSPNVSLQGVNLNFTTHTNESSTDDLEVSDLRVTLEDEELEMVNGAEDACAAAELSSIDGEQEAVHNTTIESLTQNSNHCAAGDASSSVSSTDATAASGSSNGLLTEDLSDPNESSGGGEFHVSFKTEVASNSPGHSSAHRLPVVVQNLTTPHKETCGCKEEVEKEEAQALAAAMAQSDYNQLPLPFIPGLSKEAGTSTVTIRVQDCIEWPNGERVVLDPQLSPSSSSATADGDPCGEYLEGKHWFRGPMLGTGAFSTCYQARDTKTGSLMAVKQISFCRNSMSEQEEVIETVRQEIHMMSRLNHPNVIRILGATQQACHFFMFVEWMPGGSLAYLLDRYGSFCENVIIKYTQQLLLGLSYLHENHILHRDLKGANILVDSTGHRIRIGDFGASARLASRQTAAGEFQGQLLGTIAFMAPEVLRGESYGRTCDVWSVGCVMIEMATRKPPWGATDLSNHLALIFKIASSIDPPPIPENLSPPVRDLLLRCLECQREHRPQAKELLKHPLFTMMQKS